MQKGLSCGSPRYPPSGDPPLFYKAPPRKCQLPNVNSRGGCQTPRLLAENAPWQSLQSVAGVNLYRFLSFPLTLDTLVRPQQSLCTEGSFGYPRVSTRGVRHSPVNLTLQNVNWHPPKEGVATSDLQLVHRSPQRSPLPSSHV